MPLSPLDSSCEIRPVTAAETRTAVALLISETAAAQRENFLNELAPRLEGVDRLRDSLLGAFRSEQLRGVVWFEPLAGGTASFWPPQVERGESDGLRQELLVAGVELAVGRGFRLAQALLESRQTSAIELYRSAGFDRVAELIYLYCQIAAPNGGGIAEAAVSNATESLEIQAYQPADFARLCEIVERTYVDTLDCPALNGVRPTAEVVRGYEAVGTGDCGLWRIARSSGRDVGCLLLSEHVGGVCELVYMGIVPEARGQRLSRRIVAEALRQTAAAGHTVLSLAVDAANRPALSVYEAAGFVEATRREVLLRRLSPANSTDS